MRFYSMSIQAVRDLPLNTFWMLNKSVDRLNAAEDYRQAILVAQATAGGEGLSGFLDALKDQVGEIVRMGVDKASVQHDELDRSGLSSLAGLGKM